MFQTAFVKIVNEIFSLIFVFLWFHIKSLCILFSSVITESGKTATEARCMILEIANVLKIVIFPSMVRFLILQIFKTDSIFSISFWNFFLFQVFCCKSNELWEFSLFFSDQYFSFHRVPHLLFSLHQYLLGELVKNFPGLYNQFFVLKKEAAIICLCCI